MAPPTPQAICNATLLIRELARTHSMLCNGLVIPILSLVDADNWSKSSVPRIMYIIVAQIHRIWETSHIDVIETYIISNVQKRYEWVRSEYGQPRFTSYFIIFAESFFLLSLCSITWTLVYRGGLIMTLVGIKFCMSLWILYFKACGLCNFTWKNSKILYVHI